MAHEPPRSEFEQSVLDLMLEVTAVINGRSHDAAFVALATMLLAAISNYPPNVRPGELRELRDGLMRLARSIAGEAIEGPSSRIH